MDDGLHARSRSGSRSKAMRLWGGPSEAPNTPRGENRKAFVVSALGASTVSLTSSHLGQTRHTPKRRRQCGHHWRGAAHDRIDLSHVARAVGTDQHEPVECVNRSRCDKPRPDVGSRHLNEWQATKRDPSEKSEICVTVMNGSVPPFTTAFQPACISAPRRRPERREAPSVFEYRAACSHFSWDYCLAYGKQRSKRGQFPSSVGWIGKIGDRVA